ncbi:glycine betaine ABC transporter substrate-binding protein [Methanococcoides burtonii]|uniref:ABC ProU-like glycine betaine transporter, substrate-binding subunit n=1 Tax=Methanococcoides burtonii (strain DSM 6242 / NBRC 107633 / OCM 468 / ACE-M) TaxID=259564 RepID=Q12YK4_METBU|nr:glycine betaine ABC transporter substrate-binding protein [Methanococcoides burtonii]ABE51472.1 ABC ProU-like glycine betaine transporter, substrate-binding subunit [Methanococcoides burtonii DSM 6242]
MNWKILIATFVVLAVILSGCTEPASDDTEVEKGEVVIGSKLFQESYILAHMAGIMLEEAGYEVDVKEGLGGTFVNYEGLKQGSIDVYVEYTGTAYSQILEEPALEVWDPEVVYQKAEEGLKEDGVLVVSNLGFEDAYALAVKKQWAEENNVVAISDLENHASDLIIGTDPEFALREDGLPRISSLYGFEFKEVKPTVATLMYEAIKLDEVDVISAYTTDTRNELFDLTILEDDMNALPPYDAIVVMSAEFAEANPDAVTALEKLNGQIDTETMRGLNYQFDVDKREAEDIARDFLIETGLIESELAEE